MRAAFLLLICLCAACAPEPAATPASTDSTPQRIVTLAPHLAEMVFDVGAGDRLVGVSAYTDHPEAARALPVIGDAFVVDREQLLLLDPDLLLAWSSGTPEHVVDQLRAAGFTVEQIRSANLEQIGFALRRIGELTGSEQNAQAVAARFDEDVQALREANADREPIRVFYQISQRPLYTVNGQHYISEIIELCGGVNIFEDVGDLAPMVDVEAVIDRDPEVFLAAGDASDVFAVWERWPAIAANRYGNQFLVPAGEIGRAGIRLVSAAEVVCEALSTARERRQSAESESDGA